MENNEIEKLAIEDKRIAVATITGDYTIFDKTDETEQEEITYDAVLYNHAVLNGIHGVMMTVRVGKAIKASIKYPIKPKTGLVQRFKNKVKELLS